MAERTPIRSRPQVPGGQIPADEAGMFAWAEVEEWLAAARVYWLGTAGPDGAPHATPVWGAWAAGAVYFDGYYEKTRWGRNLAANPRLVVHLESGARMVILKGTAAIVDVAPATFAEITAAFQRKYGQPADTSEGMYRLAPRVAFAWDHEDYARTATRWHFPAE